MSKGLGHIQRSVLTFLCVPSGDGVTYGRTVHGLAELIWGRRALSPVTPSHRETIRRALTTLDRLGLVELFTTNTPGETGQVRRNLAAEATPAGFEAYEQFRIPCEPDCDCGRPRCPSVACHAAEISQ
jgi:hypothetical protein